ncbi:outer membrane protein assembly factor BamB [Pseudomonas sp. TE3786]
MRLSRSLLGLALMSGFSASSQADVFLCASQAGKFTAQATACPANAPAADQSAAYAAMSDAQWDWYYSQIECIDRTFYDGEHMVGDPERMRLISRQVTRKNLPPYVEEQYDLAVGKRKAEPKLDMQAYMACDHDLADNPEPSTGSSVSLLSRVQLDAVRTPQATSITWLNWAYSREDETLELLASRDQTGYFTSGESFFHAVDLNTGNPRWRYDAGSEVLNTAISDDRVFVVAAGAPHLRVLDRTSGQVLNTLAPEAAVANLLVVGDLLIYEESSETAESLVAVDRHSLAERWRVEVPSHGADAVQVLDNTLLLSDEAYLVHAFDIATGKPRWQRQMAEGGTLKAGAQLFYWNQDEYSVQTLAVDSGKTLATYTYKEGESLELDADAPAFFNVNDDSGQLQAIDPRSGKTLWSVTPPEGRYISDLQVANGAVVAQDDNGGLMLFDRKTGALTDTLHTPPVYFNETRDPQQVALKGHSALLVFKR